MREGMDKIGEEAGDRLARVVAEILCRVGDTPDHRRGVTVLDEDMIPLLEIPFFHPSTVKNIRIRNVNVEDADSRYACLIAGVEGHPVRHVTIENLKVQFRGGLTLDDVREQRGRNPFFIPEARKESEPGEANYPEPSAHGIQPAWGFSISHAEDITLRNIHLETLQHDEREAIYLHKTARIHQEQVTTINQ